LLNRFPPTPVPPAPMAGTLALRPIAVVEQVPTHSCSPSPNGWDPSADLPLPPFNDLVHAFRRLFRGCLVNFLLFGAEIETNDEICPRRISPFGTYSLVFVNRRLPRLRRVVSVNFNVVRPIADVSTSTMNRFPPTPVPPAPMAGTLALRPIDVVEQVPTHSCPPSPNG
jgi:hypothetical protein